MPSSRESSQPGVKPMSLTSLALAGGFFTSSATWEAKIATQNKNNFKILVRYILPSSSGLCKNELCVTESCQKLRPCQKKKH